MPQTDRQGEDYEAMARKTQEEIADEAVRILKEYLDRPRTERLRELAPLVVELRSLHSLNDGRVDWSGRSPDYRQAMADIYARARVPTEELDTLQSALRYHVGNILRERTSREELAQVGLTPVAPKERIERTRELLAAQKATLSPSTDVARLAAYCQALLEYLDDAVISDLPPERAEAARLALEEVQRRAAELLVRLQDAAGRRPESSTPGRHRRGRRAQSV